MKSKWPIIPSILAAIAVSIMAALGVWQLQRKGEKEAQLAVLAANMQKPAVAYNMLGPVPDSALFRKSSVNCLRPTNWTYRSGSDNVGKTGYRYITECATGTEGPGALIVAGIGNGPNVKVAWQGGPVSGVITREPDSRSMIQKMFGKKLVLRPMLVSDTGLGGLRTPKPPSPAGLPNDHLLYAIQWFIFASAGAIIFVLAVRKKMVGK
jgi:surfeit locus 1 family protein